VIAMQSLEPLDGTLDVELPPAPYPGLRPFDKHGWPVFFGRERMTDEVVSRLINQHLVVVHGDSGCGKSSPGPRRRARPARTGACQERGQVAHLQHAAARGAAA
jgi:hypothetical protein